MPVETAADRSVFVDPDEFGSTASYTLAAGGPAGSINGILGDASSDLFGDGGMVSSAPTFICRSVDLPGGAGAGDALVIGGAHYVVRVIRRDGTGMSTLQLEDST